MPVLRSCTAQKEYTHVSRGARDTSPTAALTLKKRNNSKLMKASVVVLVHGIAPNRVLPSYKIRG